MALSSRVMAIKLNEVQRLLKSGDYADPAEPDILKGMAALYRNLMRFAPSDDIMNSSGTAAALAWKDKRVENRKHYSACESSQLRVVQNVRCRERSGDSYL